MDIYHICCSTDENYAAPCTVMLLSLAMSNPGHSWHAHVLHSSLPLSIQDKIRRSVTQNCSNITVEFHEVDAGMLRRVRFRPGTLITEAAYYRILLPTVFPLLSKILYLDCDILVLKDISPLFNIDMTHYAVAAVEDILKLKDEHRLQLNLSYADSYFNSGVMMANLDYWREHDVERRLLEFSRKERKVFFHDQDALNHVFRKQWFQLSPQWNKFYPVVYPANRFHSVCDVDDFNNPAVVHFAGRIKPWRCIKWPFDHKYRSLYYSYLNKTELVNLKPYSDLDKNTRNIMFTILREYSFHRFFTYYLTPHYLYITLRNIKHRLFT